MIAAETPDQETLRDEGRSLHLHRDNKTILDQVTPHMMSKFARDTLSKTQQSQRLDASALSKIVKAPATYVKAAIDQVPVDERLLKGIKATKITTLGKFKSRILTVSEDRFALFVTHARVKGWRNGSIMSSVARNLPLPLFSRKGLRGFTNSDYRELYVRYLDLADIDHIITGYPCTRKLENARSVNRLKGVEDRIDVYRDQIVSIGHHAGETLDVFIPNEEERTELVATLQKLTRLYHEAKLSVVDEARLLRYIWYDIDKNQDGFVSDKEFVLILNRINFHVSGPQKVYKEYQQSQGITGPLKYTQCMSLLHQIKEGKYSGNYKMPFIRIWYNLFGQDRDYVTPQEFIEKFLRPVQKESDATVEDVIALFESINHIEVNQDESEYPVKQGFLSRYRFSCYLHHFLNMAFDPDMLELDKETLNRPLTEYWINSSHNTYLMGDQLRSASSVQMYSVALQRGCRCLELDCWDGDVNPETGEHMPVLFHGGTLTGKILFEDVVDCLKCYVDSNPDTYPIILSLENHCSKPYQKEMANLMKDILGDILYAPFAKGSKDILGEDDLLPTPEQLRGRVLVKGKRPPTGKNESMDASGHLDVSTGMNVSNATDVDEEDDDIDKYEHVFSATGKRIDDKDNIDVLFNTLGKKDKKDDKLTGNIAPELAELTLFHGCKHKSWERSLAMPPNHMHSIGETKITKLINKGGMSQWRRYNTTHMSRTYPAGARVDSSNYNPVLAWSTGSQLVALNYQTADSAMILNDGRFRQNGNCGYVLKPPAVLGNGKVVQEKPITVKVRFLSGSCLPKPRGEKTGEHIDPYVQVTFHDIVFNKEGTESYKSSSYTTSTINDNGYCPAWDEEDFHSFSIYAPCVAMMQISLWEADVGLDDAVADASIPLSCLRKGYRSVMLHDKKGGRSGVFGFATLLAEIQVVEG